MAANISARKLQLEILAAQGAAYAACFLAVDCGASDCRRDRVLPVAGLAGVHAGLTMREIVARMRCHSCSGPLTSARLQTAPVSGKAVRWVQLIGRAAQGPRRD